MGTGRTEMENDENVEVQNIRVNLTHLEAEGIVRLCELFPGRMITASANGFTLMTIFGASYKEFAQIVSVYSWYLQHGYRFHVVHKPEPSITIHLNGMMK